MTDLIGFFIKRFVFSISIFAAIVMFGLVSSVGVGVDLLPNFELSFVSVNTSYPGAGSAEVAKQISEPIEDSLSTLPGINSLSSISFEGLSVVFVEFAANVDADQAAVDVSQRVNAIVGTLPDDASSPSIEKLDPNDQPILNVALAAEGENLREIQAYAEDVLEPELQRVQGIADVSIIGPVEREVQVLLDPGRLERYGFSPAQVSAAIGAASSEVPLGNLDVGGERILFAGRNVLTSTRDVEEVVVDSASGLRVEDVAVVRDATADINAYSRLDGKPVVLLEVLKQSGANSVEASESVRRTLDGLELPEGYETTVIADTTPFIRSTVSDTQGELVRAVFIVAFIVLLFIGRVGSVISVILAIPISFAGALIIFGILGFTFNIVTLLAVTVAVGLVVDDSIVIAESIDRYREQGYSKIESVKLGAGEVSVAVLASTLSLLAVFLPISFLPGILGQFFREFGLTLTATIVASYLEALFFLTVRLAYLPNPELPTFKELGGAANKLANDTNWILSFYKRRRFWTVLVLLGVAVGAGFIAAAPELAERLAEAGRTLPFDVESSMRYVVGIGLIPTTIIVLGILVPLLLFVGRYLGRLLGYAFGAVLRPMYLAVDKFVGVLREGYGRALGVALSGANFVLIGAALMFASVFVIAPQLGFTFSPASDSAQVGLTVALPAGTDLDTTNALATRVEDALIGRPEIVSVQASVGVNTSDVGNISSSGRAEFVLELVPKGEREFSDEEYGLRYQEEVRELLADYPEADITGGAVQNAGPPETSDYAITLASSDLELLRERDDLARQVLERAPYFNDVDSDLDTSVSERVFRLNQTALIGTGLSVNDVYTTLRAYNVGIEAAQLRQRSGSEYPVQVRVDPASLRDEQALLSLPISSPVLERSIPLGELGRFVLLEAPSSITRTGQTYTTEIRGDVLPGDDIPAVSEIREEMKEALSDAGVLDERVTESSGTGLDLTGDLVRYTPIAFALALLLNYLVIASQFNSFKFPIYLLLTVPLALVGVLWLFFIFNLFTNLPLDLNSVLGIVILTGLVTKNAILLLDIVVNKTEDDDESLRDLLIRAGKLRLRPILMTTSTLVAISIPLLLGAGEGSEFRRPLGLVIFGGVTFSALMTLFVVPAAFYRFERGRFAPESKEEKPPQPKPQRYVPTSTD